jgi:hypothetical protein
VRARDPSARAARSGCGSSSDPQYPPLPYGILELVAGECFQSFASISNPGNKIGLAAGDEDRAKRPSLRGATEPPRRPGSPRAQSQGRLCIAVKV